MPQSNYRLCILLQRCIRQCVCIMRPVSLTTFEFIPQVVRRESPRPISISARYRLRHKFIPQIGNDVEMLQHRSNVTSYRAMRRSLGCPRAIANGIINNNSTGNKRLPYDPLPYVTDTRYCRLNDNAIIKTTILQFRLFTYKCTVKVWYRL